MRLVDCFIDTFLYLRAFGRQVETASRDYDEVRDKVVSLFDQSRHMALDSGYTEEVYTSALYAVVAYADELIMCSNWQHKAKWQAESLQRKYFDATDLGAGFYDRLNELNKFGPDRDVREVYSLCLGLGFRGKYFNNESRRQYEEVKSFNLGILLPDEAQRNVDTAILFPSAYGDSLKRVKGDYRPRVNIIPYVIAAPIIIVLAVALKNSWSILQALDNIQGNVEIAAAKQTGGVAPAKQTGGLPASK